MRAFRYLLAAGFFVVATAAYAIEIESPNTGQTYAKHTVVWKQLRWIPRSGGLVASISFNNDPYADQDDPPKQERFDFLLPGVTFDSASGVFSAKDETGEMVQVAKIKKSWLGKSIELLPTTTIEIISKQGAIRIKLTTSAISHSGERWQEHGS